MKKLLFVAAMVLFAGTAFGQNLQKGSLLGFHTGDIVLNPDVTMNQYLSFVKDKMIPGYEKNFPGVRVYVLKGLRGESPDAISMLMIFPSEAARDKYFKPDGGANEAGEAAFKSMNPLFEESNKYVKRMDSDKYTDWLVL